MDVSVKLDARKIGEISGITTRHDPCDAVVNKLGIGLAGETDSPEYNKAFVINLIVAFAGPEAQRRHDPKSIRKHALREDKDKSP